MLSIQELQYEDNLLRQVRVGSIGSGLYRFYVVMQIKLVVVEPNINL